MVATFLTKAPLRSIVPPNPARERLLVDLERIESYPTLSETAIKVATLVASADTSIAEVSGIIRSDGVLAATVLRAANTWTYRGKNEIDDVQQAVLRLGLQECGKLLCAVGMRGMYAHTSPKVQRRCDILLRHALLVARLASGATKFLKKGIQPGAAFTSGLLHDIGRVVVAVKCPEDADDADPINYREDMQTLSRERDWLGIDHCAIGYQFAMRNSLPEGVVRVALNHHRPEEEHFHRELVAFVSVMDDVANYAQREHNISGYKLSDSPVYPEFSRDRTSTECAKFAKVLPELVVQSFKDARAMLKSIS